MKILLILLLVMVGCGIAFAEEYTIREKSIIPERHMWSFTKDELGEVLKLYLEQKNVNVPHGRTSIWFEDCRTTIDSDCKPSATLVIDTCGNGGVLDKYFNECREESK